MVMTKLSNYRGRAGDMVARAVARTAVLFKRPEPKNWLEKQLRKETEGAERARRTAAERQHLYMQLWRKLRDTTVSGTPLTACIRDIYLYSCGERVTINIYPSFWAIEWPVEFEAGLLASLDMTVVRRRVEAIGSWSSNVERIFDGPSALGKETTISLQSVPAGPGCRVVERVEIEPEHEVIKYEVECFEGESDGGEENRP